jgi:hypothetical protein
MQPDKCMVPRVEKDSLSANAIHSALADSYLPDIVIWSMVGGSANH